MNYEKKYKNTLTAVKKLQETNPSDEGIQNWIDDNFPELNESEDEKIRKEFCKDIWTFIPNEKAHKYIAWLEKRGERKPTNKIEPKFKVGDWVILTEGELSTMLQIIDVDTDKKMYWFNDSTYLPIADEECLHLWTINDAKAGDALVWDDSKCIAIFKNIYNEVSFNSYGFVGHCTGIFEQIQSYHYIEGAHPATKKQRDTLFARMNEAGYEWDAEKKELKKIHNALEECEIEHIEHGKYYYCIKDYYSGGCKRVSKGEVVKALRGMSMMALGVKANKYFIPVKCIIDVSPAWSEEDKKIMKEIAEFIYISVFKPKDIKKKEKWLTWLEKQVEEIEKIANGWNKENVINCIGMILTDASEQRFKDYGLNLKVCLDWLKKQGEPKTELATEDEIYWLEWVIGRLPDTEKANEAESVLKELLEKLKAKKGGEE